MTLIDTLVRNTNWYEAKAKK